MTFPDGCLRCAADPCTCEAPTLAVQDDGREVQDLAKTYEVRVKAWYVLPAHVVVTED